MRMLSAGEMVLVRRRRVGLTQEDVAVRAGISKKSVQRVEDGQSTSKNVLEKIAGILYMPRSILTINEAVRAREEYPSLGPLDIDDQKQIAYDQMQALNGLCDPDPSQKDDEDE